MTQRTNERTNKANLNFKFVDIGLRGRITLRGVDEAIRYTFEDI